MTSAKRPLIVLDEVDDPDLRAVFSKTVDLVAHAHCYVCDRLLADLIRTDVRAAVITYELDHVKRRALDSVGHRPSRDPIKAFAIGLATGVVDRVGYPRWVEPGRGVHLRCHGDRTVDAALVERLIKTGSRENAKKVRV